MHPSPISWQVLDRLVRVGQQGKGHTKILFVVSIRSVQKECQRDSSKDEYQNRQIVPVGLVNIDGQLRLARKGPKGKHEQ